MKKLIYGSILILIGCKNPTQPVIDCHYHEEIITVRSGAVNKITGDTLYIIEGKSVARYWDDNDVCNRLFTAR